MKQKQDVLQGTLALMVLKTIDVLGPLHGYGIARRIEQISGDLLSVNQGTLYPVMLRLEQRAPSHRSGVLRRTTAARAFIGSRVRGKNYWMPKSAIGSRLRRSSRAFLK